MHCFKVSFFDYDTFLGLMNLKFCLFLEFFATIDHSCNNANINYPNAIEPTLLPNVISRLITIIFVGSAFWKVCEEIVSYPFGDPIKLKVNEPKKKKLKKLKWEIYKVYKDRWATRFIWSKPIYDGDMKMTWWGVRFFARLKGEI